jgi:hypothetical protein
VYTAARRIHHVLRAERVRFWPRCGWSPRRRHSRDPILEQKTFTPNQTDLSTETGSTPPVATAYAIRDVRKEACGVRRSGTGTEPSGFRSRGMAGVEVVQGLES